MIETVTTRGAGIRRLMEVNPTWEDGTPFFWTTRNNLMIGAGSHLTAANIQAAIASVAENGGGVARCLLVPPALMYQAAQLLSATVCIHAMVGADDRVSGPIITLYVCPELTSSTAWAVAVSLDTEKPDPGAWVRYSGV